MSKTNVIRILKQKLIQFNTVSYNYFDEQLDAKTVANKIKVNPEIVFKILVARGNQTGINVFCIPGNFELNKIKLQKLVVINQFILLKLKNCCLLQDTFVAVIRQ